MTRYPSCPRDPRSRGRWPQWNTALSSSQPPGHRPGLRTRPPAAPAFWPASDLRHRRMSRSRSPRSRLTIDSPGHSTPRCTEDKQDNSDYTHNGDLNIDPPDLLNHRTSPHSLAHHLMRSPGIHGSDIVFLLHKFLKNFKTILHLDIFLFNLLFTRTCPCCPLSPETVCDAGPEVAGPGIPSLAPTGPASKVTVAADKPPANLHPGATGS